ncbi:hypothetical protein PV08_04551 [Exophiala spinifera]|uniref:Uncharacterized protein n=1 Tax=Exophiala spinifera TaxID=91928 RepID=A0A0D2C100_9EURO|nr:uncharacterized protein PV08_04551 [Exophiala spinifera]KIW17359.1 hypothetical protein PV08_04551 [Exophiala spinifera]
MVKQIHLQTDSLSLIPKKYRGEADDPHFIPDSPLIERQVLTEQEEAELKRMCSLMLANVQHSDDMSDDPLKYIAAQIHEGNPPPDKVKQVPRSEASQRQDTNVTQEILDLHIDSALSSKVSHRDTFSSADDYSTPLTSAGFTPVETTRRFSDTTRKSAVSAKRAGSSLRNETLGVMKSRKTSSSGLQRTAELSTLSPDADTVRRNLRIVPSDSSPLRTRAVKSMDVPRDSRFSAPDLNKELPPPPPEQVQTDDEAQPHISRLMKTIRKKKSPTTENRSFSTASAPSGPNLDSNPASAKEKISCTPAARQAPVQVQTESIPKKRFRLRLFSRRQRPTDILVT